MILTEADIAELYTNYIIVNNNKNYISRYDNLSNYKNDKNWKWGNKDFPRVIMVLEFDRYVKKYNLNSKHLLSFNSYNDPELEYLPFEKTTNFNYSDNIIDYNLHTLNIPKDDYDFVVLNQTFEHLYNPYLCLSNINKYLPVGAYIYSNVPTVNIQHSLPNNFYTGYTPIGLAAMFKSCGFDILEVGQWGNKDYINKIFSTHQWPDYNNVDHTNEFLNPVQCWILAQKK